MNYITVIHNSTREYIFPVERNTLIVRVIVSRGQANSCKIVYHNKFRISEVFTGTLKCVNRDERYDYYLETLTFQESAKYLSYYFEVETDLGMVFIGRYGTDSKKPEYCFEYLSTAENDILSVPEWAKGTICYQIFPERFYDGDHSNNPADAEGWGATPTRDNHFGGDIAGIIKKIPYLQQLGIEVIYLTPIFKSPSNHKYDTIDYFSIDPAFGTMKLFIQMVRECHLAGIKVILDGVFNHCGYYFAQFQDVVNYGSESKYTDWFYIDSFPINTDPLNYECVGYYKWMPKLRYKTQAVRDYFINIGRYWIEKADIDGWRLDVADEVDFTFLQEFRRAIKAIKPDAFLLAETWQDGCGLLRGDQMDSVMNYLFRDAVVDFFARGSISAKLFDERIQKMLQAYPVVVQPTLYNLLGSHDTTRFATLCKNEMQKFRLAVAYQMSFPGMPAIYYGDETGLDGENDPDCRKTMNWSNIDTEQLAFYHKLITYRKDNLSLKYGDYKVIYCNEQVIGFSRTYELETSYVIINNSKQQAYVDLPIFQSINEIKTIKSFHEIDYAFPNRLSDNDKFTNDDIYTYRSVFKVVLPAYHFEIITIKEDTK